MRRMLRFAALIPVVAFVAACGAPGPTGQITSSDPYEAVSGDATAMLAPPACKTIIGVDVKMLAPADIRKAVFQARYRYSMPGAGCERVPTWEASRPGLLVDRENPFRASIPRHGLHERTVVTATAPNGIKGSLVF